MAQHRCDLVKWCTIPQRVARHSVVSSAEVVSSISVLYFTCVTLYAISMNNVSYARLGLLFVIDLLQASLLDVMDTFNSVMVGHVASVTSEGVTDVTGDSELLLSTY